MAVQNLTVIIDDPTELADLAHLSISSLSHLILTYPSPPSPISFPLPCLAEPSAYVSHPTMLLQL